MPQTSSYVVPTTGAFVVGAIAIRAPTEPMFCAAYCSVCESPSTRVVNWLVFVDPSANLALIVVTHDPVCVVTPKSTPNVRSSCIPGGNAPPTTVNAFALPRPRVLGAIVSCEPTVEYWFG